MSEAGWSYYALMKIFSHLKHLCSSDLLEICKNQKTHRTKCVSTAVGEENFDDNFCQAICLLLAT